MVYRVYTEIYKGLVLLICSNEIHFDQRIRQFSSSISEFDKCVVFVWKTTFAIPFT